MPFTQMQFSHKDIVTQTPKNINETIFHQQLTVEVPLLIESGKPVAIIPCSSSPNQASKFTLLITENLNFVHAEHRTQPWIPTEISGKWESSTAGGCTNYADTFLTNPQFVLEVKENCMLNILLSQANQELPISQDTIGFYLVKTLTPNERLAAMPSRLDLVEKSLFANKHEAYRFIQFMEGPKTYIIVPCTFDPGYTNDFHIYLSTDKPDILSIHELENDHANSKESPRPDHFMEKIT